jgi:hypothetical protein
LTAHTAASTFPTFTRQNPLSSFYFASSSAVIFSYIADILLHMPWLPYIFNRNPTPAAPSSIMHGKPNPLRRKRSADDEQEEDEEWSDIGSEDSKSNTRTETNDSPRRGERVYTQEERALLPYMPTLFSDDLPPCGLIPQIAYENVVQRLRKLWLQRAVDHPVNIHVLDLCKQVAEELSEEADDQPVDSQLGTKARRPWRRENVFKYEASLRGSLLPSIH